MTTTPFFEDTSLAGYDQTCHDLTCQAAVSWGLDPYDPIQRLQVIQRLSIWLQKLAMHTRLALPTGYSPYTDPAVF